MPAPPWNVHAFSFVPQASQVTRAEGVPTETPHNVMAQDALSHQTPMPTPFVPQASQDTRAEGVPTETPHNSTAQDVLSQDTPMPTSSSATPLRVHARQKQADRWT